MSFSRRVLHMDPCPWSAPKQARRRDGIPASTPHVLRHTGHPVHLVILGRAPRVPVATGTGL
jgi:hypothetical protein